MNRVVFVVRPGYAEPAMHENVSSCQVADNRTLHIHRAVTVGTETVIHKTIYNQGAWTRVTEEWRP